VLHDHGLTGMQVMPWWWYRNDCTYYLDASTCFVLQRLQFFSVQKKFSSVQKRLQFVLRARSPLLFAFCRITGPVAGGARVRWFGRCHMRALYRVFDTNKKNKLQNLSVIHKTNLLSLINPSSAHVYCSITLSNHRLIRLKKFVSQNSLNLCI
jgi:hypothetical protein